MNQTIDNDTFAGDTTILIYTVIIISLSSVGLCVSVIAILTLRRTRRTPETARFLHSGLLILNTTGLVFLLSRQLQNIFNFYNDLQFSLQVFELCFATLAHLTVGLMSVERSVLFSAPYFYARILTTRKVKIIAFMIWTSYTTFYLFGRFGICYLIQPSSTMVETFDNCVVTFRSVHLAVVCSTTLATIASYTQIYRIERRKNGHNGRKTCLSTIKILLRYKSTSIVILNVLTTYTVSISLFFLVRHFFNHRFLGNIVVFDFFSLISCVTDPFLYVIWFKECRYELIKLFTCNSRYNPTLERMRMEIFNIVVKEDASNVCPCNAETHIT